MINPNELRLGNYILHKTGVRILPVALTFQHFELFAKGQLKDSFPIPFKADLLLKTGFVENKQYYLHPEAREFVLTLPVMGVNTHEVRAYINANNESYARAVVNEMVITNHFHHLHQLQNVYYSLTGGELAITL